MHTFLLVYPIKVLCVCSFLLVYPLILKLVFTLYFFALSQTIKLPDRPRVQSRSLGCNNFATFYEAFVVDDGPGKDLVRDLISSRS